MRLILFFAFLFICPVVSVLAQEVDTVYLDAQEAILPEGKGPLAVSYTINRYEDEEGILKSEKSFYITGEKKSEALYKLNPDDVMDKPKPIGVASGWYKSGNPSYQVVYAEGDGNYSQTYWFENGQVSQVAHFKRNNPEGKALDYYQDGQVRRVASYADSKLLKGNYCTRTGQDTTFFERREIPSFKGGDEGLKRFVENHLRYPAQALKDNIEGVVVVNFIIDHEGKVKDIKIVKKVSKEIDAEAIRIARMLDGKFKPARIEGKPVSFLYICPIRFGLK